MDMMAAAKVLSMFKLKYKRQSNLRAGRVSASMRTESPLPLLSSLNSMERNRNV